MTKCIYKLARNSGLVADYFRSQEVVNIMCQHWKANRRFCL